MSVIVSPCGSRGTRDPHGFKDTGAEQPKAPTFAQGVNADDDQVARVAANDVDRLEAGFVPRGEHMPWEPHRS
jgi:hypothetical protein